jgi:hypothetical protein
LSQSIGGCPSQRIRLPCTRHLNKIRDGKYEN